jgi:two-component system, OmpR family, sensor histidine kinase KdpD
VSRPSPTVREPAGKIGRPEQHLLALGAVAVTLVVVGALDEAVPGLQTLVLLYVVPITVAATRWGFGPAITAALASALGHDVLFIEPVGSLTIARADEALGLVLLLFTALVTSQLAVMARRGADRAREAEVARRSDALKTALLRTVSHDLRTPLASIKASVSGLRQPEAHYTEDDRAELLAAIEEEADRLTRLVSDLLDASRLEAGVLTPDRREYDLAELIDAVVRRLQPTIGDRPLTIEIPELLPPVAYDYTQVDRIVTNLLENAAVHTPAGSPLAISVRPADDEIRVEVTDHGPGVPPEDRERLFRPFERGRTSARGSGLGLAIARGFTEAHGGRIWIEEVPRGGARFVFTLPVQAGASSNGLAAASERRP